MLTGAGSQVNAQRLLREVQAVHEELEAGFVGYSRF